MNHTPLVSFVVPCYNFGHLLPQCVNSILSQTFADFEVLIMDNASPDDTSEVAQSFNDPRIRYIRNETNLGHVRNFNKGLELAGGKYLWLIAADDFLRSSLVLGRYVEEMERSPQVGFAFCRSTELRDGVETGIAPWADCGDQDRLWSQPDLFIRLIESNCIVMSSVMMRRECFEKVGPFQLDLPFALDWYMWCTLALHYDAAYFSEPMVCCRFHEESLTSKYSQEHARICVADELTVLWRAGQKAGLMGNPVLRGVCKATFVLRAGYLLMAGLNNLAPSMTVDQFEEILQTRIRDSDDLHKIRAAVYGSLAEYVPSLIDKDSLAPRITGDLEALLSLLLHAETTGLPILRRECERVFTHRTARLLSAGLHGVIPSLNQDELAAILQSRIPNRRTGTEIRAKVFTNLADQLYSSSEYSLAAHWYWLGLMARPWRLKTWMKLLLLRTGSIGIRIRRMAI